MLLHSLVFVASTSGDL